MFSNLPKWCSGDLHPLSGIVGICQLPELVLCPLLSAASSCELFCKAELG